MNDSPDGLNPPTSDIDASNGALDPALAAELDTYFAARRTLPPDPEAFWQRLVTHLEARETHDTPSALAAPVAVLPDIAVPHQQPARHGRHAPAHRPPTSRLRRAVSSMAAIAAVLLLSLGSLALFHQLGLVASDGQTIQRGHLIWHLVNLPPGVVLTNGAGVTEYHDGQSNPANTPGAAQPNATLTVASANGDVAYICEVPRPNTALLWRTTDGGEHWSRLPDLPPGDTFTACGVQTDANNALTVMVLLGDPSQATTTRTVYVLFVEHTSWRRLPEAVNSFAYSRGIYYAIRDSDPASGQKPQGHLYVSTDHMLSWRAIDAPLIAENLAAAKRLKLNGATGVEQFWVQPQTGEILAQTYDGVLWHYTVSLNGDTWTQIKLPALPPAGELTPTPGEMIEETGQPGAAIVFVQQPAADYPFTLCALVMDQTLTLFNVAPLYCSTDSGQTWTRRPRPAVPQGNGKPDQFQMPSTMLPDGSLLSTYDNPTTIYRMPGNNTAAPIGFVVGTIPPPHDPNDIPSGLYGVTARGVTLWQPLDTQTLYVAQYSISPSSTAP